MVRPLGAPVGVFGEKEKMCRKKERGKKCCNCRERVKSVFEVE